MRTPAPDVLGTCGLAITVPLTRDRFLADHRDASKEFVRLWGQGYPGLAAERLWAQYRGVAEYGLQVAAETEAAGVRVSLDATLAAFAALLARSRVVTLVAHWATTGDAIEFADRIVPIATVIATLPADFDGAIDLTVCTSTKAIAAFKRARPRCTVIANREPTPLDIRLAMYRQTIGLLQHEPMSYVDAAHYVRLAALEAL